MSFYKVIFIVIIAYAVGETAIYSLYSSEPIDQNAPYETLVFSISSIYMCSQKCLVHECHHIGFNGAENRCNISGKVIIGLSSYGHITQGTFSMKPANIVRPSFQTDSSSYVDENYSPAKGIDLNLGTMFHSTIETNPWWSIDLENIEFVTKIRVTMRANLLARFGDVSIYLSPVAESDPSKFKDLPLFAVILGSLPAPTWNISSSEGGLSGRYMYIQMNKREYLEFWEIEIYRC